MAEPLDVGLAFVDVALAVFVVDLVLDFAAAAFAAVCRAMSTGMVQILQELTFLASVLALVVFLVDDFFTVAAFLVVEVAFLGAAAGFFVVADLSVAVLVLVVTAFLVSVAFFAGGAFLDGGLAFCGELNDTTRGRDGDYVPLWYRRTPWGVWERV